MIISDKIATEEFEKYYSLLVEWNKKFNLTSVIERDDVYLKHFYDSILPEKLIPQGARCLDVGSGAGFPAIPLKLIRPDLDYTLIDSVNKKITFLNEVISSLGIGGCKAIHTRVEDFRERNFDVVTSRAVAPLNVLCEYCLPFLKKGGFMLAYKALDAEAELASAENAIKILGGGSGKIIRIPLTDEVTRAFILIEKVAVSPEKYPRGGNKPRLSPL